MGELTAVSLFAGIEGIGLALHRAGIRVAAAVEIDPAARGVIADQFPDVTLIDDVTKVTADDLRATGFDPRRGLLAAGWPCQGNSVAGRRGGMADARSGLWLHVARLLAELRPRWFLGENVPGLLSVNAGRDFATVIGDLAGLGYGYCWRVLDAQHFGVPQRRRRVFIVGRLGDRAAPVQVLLEPEGRGGDPAAGRTAGTRVAATLTAGSHAGGVSAPGRRSEDDENVVVSTLQGGGKRGDRVDAESAAGGLLVPFDAAQITSGENRSNPQPGDPQPSLNATGNPHVAYALRADPGGTGQGHNVTYIVSPPLTAEGHDASEDGTGRAALVPMAFNPQTGGDFRLGYGDKPTALHRGQETAVHTATEVRRLTPLERERLQGFPDGWTLTSNGRPQSDSARNQQLGNAVAVPCVEWIAHRIAATEVTTP